MLAYILKLNKLCHGCFASLYCDKGKRIRIITKCNFLFRWSWLLQFYENFQKANISFWGKILSFYVCYHIVINVISVNSFTKAISFRTLCRSNHQRCSIKKGVLGKFTGKHLCQSLFLNKVAGLRLFTSNTSGGWFCKVIFYKCITHAKKPFAFGLHRLTFSIITNQIFTNHHVLLRIFS